MSFTFCCDKLGQCFIRTVLISGLLLVTISHATVHSSPTEATEKKSVNHFPCWNELTAFQQQILSPLAPDWNKFKPSTRKKWLEISHRYATMTPAEQQRLQTRMRTWATYTPEQRRIARENYARTHQINIEQKAQRWRQYQQLSEQQKKELAEQAELKRKHTTTVPPGPFTAASSNVPGTSLPVPEQNTLLTPLKK